MLKRRVEYSNELQAKIDSGELSEKEVEVLKKYKNAFEEGMDMNAFIQPNKCSWQSGFFAIYLAFISFALK
ncbi:MAG: hypothetical protein ACLVJU_10905 [Blautia sp.]